MTADKFIARLDYALLKPDARVAELVGACDEMIRNRFNSLCVSPWLVPYAVERLNTHALAVGTVVGFPLGTSTLATKSFEAEEAVRNGARMLDIVVPIGRLKSQDMEGFRDELRQLREWASRFAVDAPVIMRGILETGLLTDKEIEQSALAVMEAGWEYVKTSTGFGPRGAQAAEVTMLARLVGGRAKVKASGGIRDATDALKMFKAGADIVGSGRAPAIADELRELESRGQLQD